MSGEEKPSPDEQAALRELEKLQIAIEESRGRRRRANDAFDQFVKTFDESRRLRATALDIPARTPAPTPAPPPSPPLGPPPPPFLSEMPPAMIEPPRPTEPPRVAEPPRAIEPVPELPPIPAALAPPPAARRTQRLPAVATIAAVAVIALGLAWYRSGANAPAATNTQSQPTPVPSPAPVPSAAATSGNEAPPPAELRTSRRVWMRVTVDGSKVIEREVEAAARIPLQAASEILIRAGDAGAVRVSIAGKDLGVLGADGQIATKRFALGRNR